MDPAITIPVKLLPPRKYPVDEPRFVLLNLYQVKKATAAVKRRKRIMFIAKFPFISNDYFVWYRIT